MSTTPPSDGSPGAPPPGWDTGATGGTPTQDLFDQITGAGAGAAFFGTGYPGAGQPGPGPVGSGQAPWGANPFGQAGYGPGTASPGYGPQTGFGAPGQFGVAGYGGPGLGVPGFGVPGFAVPGQFGGPGNTPMQPRRRPWLRAIGWLIVLGGLATVALGVKRIVDDFRWRNDRVVASGQDSPRPLQVDFTRTDGGDGSYTLDIRSTLGNSTPTTYAKRANCSVGLADGTSVAISGASQSFATALDGYATIGSFRAPTGPVTVACTVQFGSDIYVAIVRGGPPSIFPWLAWVITGVVLLIVGAVVAKIGGRQRWVPVALPT